MSSAQHLREFISQRLTAAAEEIFTEFEKIIVQYEEEIDRQRRLLDITWKPQISFHRVDLPQHYLCQEQLNLQKDSSLDQQEPEPPQIKEEQVEVCTSQETENFTVGRPQQEPEPTSEQLLRQNSQWSRGQEGSGHESPGTAELRGKKTHHRDDGDGSSTSGSGRNTVKDFSQQYVCEEQEEFLSDQRFFHHQSNSSLEQEEPEPPHFKEELEEPESPQFKEELEEQEEEWLVLKEEADIVLVTPIYEESDHSEQELSDQLLSQNSSAAQSQDLGKNWHEESESTQTAKPQPNKRHERTDGISESPFNAGDTGDRTAECEVCGRAFRSYSELRAHYRLHTGKKPHSCETCRKAFRCSTDLEAFH
ncbi:uncharacterized protein [Leuresthes tenuis]|uniref:uncharacterized protein n=1 Tax=Leuresthes tenuis TaxID=355514 RepID=UPI003B506323